jgi:hypothetical protein
MQDEVTVPVIMGLTKALRDANVAEAASDLLALLQPLHVSITSQPNPLAALPVTSTDAAFLLCRLDTLGLRPGQATEKRNPQAASANGSGSSGSSSSGSSTSTGAQMEEVPLAELLTRRLAAGAAETPPGLLVCATLASSTLLGYMHVPLVKVRTRLLFPCRR